jgi:Zn-dependent peptidase ImmA (M78 family)
VNLRASPELESSCLCAAHELSRWFAKSTPPFCPTWLAERFGVSEVRERPLDRDARLIRESGRLFIEVNNLFPKLRRRFSIAHEIGHLIIDRCSPRGQSHWGHEDPMIESLCDRLAGRLLAPDWALQEHFEREGRLDGWQGPFECSFILETAAKFGVSVDIIASRVFEECAAEHCGHHERGTYTASASVTRQLQPTLWSGRLSLSAPRQAASPARYTSAAPAPT